MPLPIVLASSSPFRQQLLEKITRDFSSFSPDIDETALENESAERLVERLAIAKAKAVAEHYPHHLIIGSDQVCVLNGQIVGKPGDHSSATKQLTSASGKTVTFYTGLALFNSSNGQHRSSVELFKVSFRDLSADLIDRYLKLEQPYNCAGSFKSEGAGITLFDKLEGDDPNTLVGLPLIRLCRWLEEEDWLLPN